LNTRDILGEEVIVLPLGKSIELAKAGQALNNEVNFEVRNPYDKKC